MIEHGSTKQLAEVIVTLRLRFKPNTIENILSRILPIAQQTRDEEGNIAFDVYRARDETDLLIIFEHWRDQAALEQHWAADYTKEALDLFQETLLKPLSEERDVTYLIDART